MAMDARMRREWAESYAREQRRIYNQPYATPARQRLAQVGFATLGGLGYTYLRSKVQNAVNTNYLRGSVSEDLDEFVEYHPYTPTTIPPSTAAPVIVPTAAPLLTPSATETVKMPMPQIQLTAAQKKRIADNRAAALAKRARLTRAPAASRGFFPTGAARHEIKATDFGYTGHVITTLPTANGVVWNNIASGSSFFQRIGRRVALKSIYVNGLFKLASGANGAPTAQQVRIVVVYDSQTNGATATWADVIQAVGNTGTTSSTIADGLNLSNRDRFKLLIDKRFIMPAVGPGTGGSVPSSGEILGGTGVCTMTPLISEYRYLAGMETMYGADSTPPVIGDIKTGSILFFGHGETAEWNLNYSVRLRFTDL